MNDEPATVAEPNLATLGGSSASAAARRLFLATRPKFFPASALPVVAGCAWGYAVSGRFFLLISAVALLATMLVHAASNVINDVGDDINGTDAANTSRLYPFTGGSRFIQNGILSAAQMRRWGITLLLAAALLGVWLTAVKGPEILVFGIIGAALAVLYSMPGAQLSGRGIGEVCIAIAFGLVPVTGAAWLQSGVVDLNAILMSMPVGCWVAAILLINEVPDRDADASAGKRTWPVRYGFGGTQVLYLGLHLVGFGALVLLVLRSALPAWSLSLPLLLLAGAAFATQRIRLSAADMTALLPGIKATLTIQMIGCLWLTAVALIGPVNG